MGHTESKERGLFVDIVLCFLRKRGVKVSQKAVYRFLSFVQECSPWFPEGGTFTLEVWNKVGRQMRDFCSVHGPAEAFALWSLFREAMTLDPDLLKGLVRPSPPPTDDWGGRPRRVTIRYGLSSGP